MADHRAIGELDGALREVVPEGSFVEVLVMPSGSFHVTVRRSDGPIVVMQGRPRREEYGLTPDMRSEDAGFDDGHPFVLHDYDQAIEALLNLASAKGSGR